MDFRSTAFDAAGGDDADDALPVVGTAVVVVEAVTPLAGFAAVLPALPVATEVPPPVPITAGVIDRPLATLVVVGLPPLV